MPAPGEQHLHAGSKSTTNPFEEVKPRMSEYTAQEIATLQSRLEKQLGPEYISSRAGPSGQKVHYVAAEKCIQLANEIFGFNGWSSQIMDVQVDYVDENPTTLKVSLGLSVIVRVTLRDGTFHEDVGYGHMENSKGKAAAFEKAKKEGTTDALKRALRNFGNVLGNCIYDKDYLSKVTKVKAPPTKWDVANLHRHSTYVPPAAVIATAPKLEEKKGTDSGMSNSTEDTLEDEFGDFDEADFGVADPESHPDEVTLPVANSVPSHHSNGNPRINKTHQPQHQIKPTPSRQQQPMIAPSRPQNPPPQPQTPNSNFTRSNNGAGRAMHPPPPPITGPGPPPVLNGRVLNQPSRTAASHPPSAPISPVKSDPNPSDDIDVGLPPPGAGFFSARAATMIPEDALASEATGTGGPPSRIPGNLPAFDPHAESPSIRKTPGVDHRVTKPLGREGKHVPAVLSASQAVAPVAGPGGLATVGGNVSSFGAAGGGGRASTVGAGFSGNPQIDGVRRIGAPGSPSPLGNRNSYKPPTMMKRPAGDAITSAGRTPLLEMPTNGTGNGGSGGADGPDLKRQRLSD